MHVRRVALSLLATLLLSTPVAGADPMPMTAGVQPVPAVDSEVVLLLEDLRITVGFEQAEVQARFRFRNEGPERTLQVGFPCTPKLEGPMSTLYCKMPLEVRVEGRHVKPRRLPPSKGSSEGHWVWPMVFGASKDVDLDLRYTTPLVNERYGLPLSGMAMLHYRLATGARWAGPIHKLEIEVQLPLETLAHIWPPGYEREPGRLRWRLRDVEPSHDLALFTYPMLNGAFLGALRAKSASGVRQALREGKYDGQRLVALAQRMRSELPELAEQVAFFARISQRGRQLHVPQPEEVRRCALESIRLLEDLAGKVGAHPPTAGETPPPAPKPTQR